MSKTIVITGASGVIGQSLIRLFKEKNDKVITFTHQQSNASNNDTTSLFWDPKSILSSNHNQELVSALNSADCIINLAGSSVADGRMGTKHRQKILNSRLESTLALVKLFEETPNKPPVWIQASATGYYGDLENTEVDESGPKGNRLLSEVCEKWENAISTIKDSHSETTRLVIARIGLVLSKDAPAWQRLFLPIKWGLGGRLGSGSQWWSWIHIDDLVNAFYHFITQKSTGIYNLTTPHPIKQSQLVEKIAKHINRPTIFPTPELLLKLTLGKAANELVLNSAKILPQSLITEKFNYIYPTLDKALTELLE
ncbi:TIGR01777 family protein [Candidatus Marinamargulisbacteria bacterium SCGC AG-439-L15]|nr:TIGR01777 family protein [Candidatus Marinamargulisbacteria bacterium SCGC AG-439-L15]